MGEGRSMRGSWFRRGLGSLCWRSVGDFAENVVGLVAAEGWIVNGFGVLVDIAWRMQRDTP
jgi:hypothetical protein